MRIIKNSAAPWRQPYPYIRRCSYWSVDDKPVYEWEAYIPPTRPEHFDNGDVEKGAVLGPWGESYWPTFQAAHDFMQSCAKEIREAVYGPDLAVENYKKWLQAQA